MYFFVFLALGIYLHSYPHTEFIVVGYKLFELSFVRENSLEFISIFTCFWIIMPCMF